MFAMMFQTNLRPRLRRHAPAVARFGDCRLPAALRQAGLFAVASLTAATLFIFLHYLGDRIPYDLAQQRFAVVADADRASGSEGVVPGYFDGARRLLDFEFCQISAMVMGEAHRVDGDSWLESAVLPGILKRTDPNRISCVEFPDSANSAELREGKVKFRYWWGSKALFAIGLRFLSVLDIHRVILFSTYGAWLLLAGGVALMGWRAFIIAAPVIAFGLWLSGTGYFADIANGIPTLWAVLSAAILALLFYRAGPARRAPLFCFIAGTGSAYFWLSDGHTAIAVVLIGLVAWLGYGRLGSGAEIRRAAGCVALYAAGFVICVALMLTVKGAVYEWSSSKSGWNVAQNYFNTVTARFERLEQETLTGVAESENVWVVGCPGCGESDWQNLPVVRDLRGFWIMSPLGRAGSQVLSAFSALALLGAAVMAGWQAKRGRTDILQGLLWLITLGMLASLQFFLPSDVPFRNARLSFLLLALGWAGLALAVTQLNLLIPAILAGCLAGLMLISIVAAFRFQEWRVATAIDNAQPVIHSNATGYFDVYMDDKHNRLIYIKDGCGLYYNYYEPPILLHITPADPGNLSADRKQYGFDNRDFYFRSYSNPIEGNCVAVYDLPDYGISHIRTGQYISDSGTIWEAKFPADILTYMPEYEEAAADIQGELVVQSEFDIYLRGGRLIYWKESCTVADTRAKFFLHVTPEQAADLPAAAQYGFDNLDFGFYDRGGMPGGKCVAIVPLPDYAIARIRTGQFAPGEGQLWRAEFAPER